MVHDTGLGTGESPGFGEGLYCGQAVSNWGVSGRRIPDLMVGYRRKTKLLEVKDGTKPPSARELTADQINWHMDWRGEPVQVVCSVEEALACVMGM